MIMPFLSLPERQPHQFTGLRGMTEVTVRVRDIYNAALAAIDLIDSDNTSDLDHVAVAQQVCCQVEIGLGIYPNVPTLEPKE